MRDPVAGQTSLVIVGASGMVGGYALRYSLDNPAIGVVTVIGRKKLGISHPKLKEVLHQDFTDCSALAQPLTGQDAAIFCLAWISMTRIHLRSDGLLCRARVGL